MGAYLRVLSIMAGQNLTSDENSTKRDPVLMKILSSTLDARGLRDGNFKPLTTKMWN